MKEFILFAKEELDLDSLPSIVLIPKHISSKISNSFASYSPSEKRIRLFVRNRHILDVLRSLAHEMVHYKQDLEGRLKTGSGNTGSTEENEAHSVAGQIMRNYGRLHPELF